MQAIIAFIFWEPAHWLMQTRQFANLKRLAERDPAASDQFPIKSSVPSGIS